MTHKLFVDVPPWWVHKLHKRSQELSQAKDPSRVLVDAETEREEDQPFQGTFNLLRNFDQAVDEHIRDLVAPAN
jgi:hypothetical protein